MRGVSGTEYIIKDKYSFTVRRYDTRYFTSKNLEECMLVRNYLRDNIWVEDENKHICYRANKKIYEINKYHNGKMVYYGKFNTLKEARKVRDWLIKNNWEWIVPDEDYHKFDFIYHYFNGSFRICRNNHHYGIYDSLTEALNAKKVFEANNWGWEPAYDMDKRYIRLTPAGNYIIVKKFNGCPQYFGTFNCLEDAIKERDLLMENNWNYDNLESINESDKLVCLNKEVYV